jgi:hypothetical protein
MRYERTTLRILGLIVLMNCTRLALASDPPLPQPVATLDTSQLLPNQRDLTFTTVAFSSDTTIEIIACPGFTRDAICPSAVFLWKNGVPEHVVQMPKLDFASGTRVLLDFNDRKVYRPWYVLDRMRAVWTFGMIYPEDVNREVVQVVDTATRKSCFDWRRIFPMSLSQMRSGAMSPSGEFVAIKVEDSLSVYRLPRVCKGPRASRRAKMTTP